MYTLKYKCPDYQIEVIMDKDKTAVFLSECLDLFFQ